VLYVKDFHGNHERFVYYLLKAMDFGRYNSGSAQPSLNRNYVHPIPVTVPPVPEQRAIAHVLGSLDDTIELNRQMNKTLEAMAQAIFKSWFVGFDPVRAKAEGRQPVRMDAATAALFPDSFEESASGEIPRGWRVGTLGEVAVINGLSITAGYPTLTPRDEDLLRRCVLSQENCVGLDLKWWAAEYGPPPSTESLWGGWTKVLNGRFILDGDGGVSRPAFLKLFPAKCAEAPFRDARMVAQKLSHVKVWTSLISGGTSLLVTEKVGAGAGDPISLAEFLAKPAREVHGHIPRIAAEIAEQVGALGDGVPERQQPRELLWPWHDAERIQTQWDKWRDHEDELLGSPVAVLHAVQQSRMLVRYSRQGLLHGDLNITNIALDEHDDGASAFIFDASGCRGGPCVRDLAMLEVTALLHQPNVPGESLVCRLAPLYQEEAWAWEAIDSATWSDRARNTCALVGEVRRHALTRSSEQVYALMVFDATLVQLGGLYFGSSNNKITDPASAARLASLTADWLRRVAPELFKDSGAEQRS
jgi:hypothetical protein